MTLPNFKTKSLIAFVLIAFIGLQYMNAQTDVKSKELINALVLVNGGYEKLASKKDVSFSYKYDNFDKGYDLSTEKHIFDGEHSMAIYTHHDINVLPKQEGDAVQSLVDGKAQLTLDGKAIKDAKNIGATVFLRKVNSYWFTMNYKLQDPGTNYEYLGIETADGIVYDKVSLTYDGAVTNKEQNDAYILYFNPETHLIDLFYFSLPAWGINKPVLKMMVNYAVIDEIYVPVSRKVYAPNEKGEYNLAGEFTFSDVKFNNGLKKEDFVLQ
ncbi:hypothetical protein CLV91_1937 [Maribacter vaceletii]|uniref:Outer membrane lipoprotein-sorting protein n=1 Tax=Maribacter vaceletii TaxID=1206816 RepID=A0A495E8G5_9FLAO|nr:DUF6503 family protein [Maribacter vaceletii]RKR13222.1 hypothetical protein CLV91_1937 [Maribacter vaceletii]